MSRIDRDSQNSQTSTSASSEDESYTKEELSKQLAHFADTVTFEQEITRATNVDRMNRIQKNRIEEIIKILDLKDKDLTLKKDELQEIIDRFDSIKLKVIVRKRQEICEELRKLAVEKLNLIGSSDSKDHKKSPQNFKFNLAKVAFDHILQEFRPKLDQMLTKDEALKLEGPDNFPIHKEMKKIASEFEEKFEKAKNLDALRDQILIKIQEKINEFSSIELKNFDNKEGSKLTINKEKKNIIDFIEKELNSLEVEGAAANVINQIKSECEKKLNQKYDGIIRAYAFLENDSLKDKFLPYLDEKSLFSSSIENEIENIERIGKEILSELKEELKYQPTPDFAVHRVNQIKKEFIDNRRNLQNKNCDICIKEFVNHVDEIKQSGNKSNAQKIKMISHIAESANRKIRKIANGSDSLKAKLSEIESIKSNVESGIILSDCNLYIQEFKDAVDKIKKDEQDKEKRKNISSEVDKVKNKIQKFEGNNKKLISEKLSEIESIRSDVEKEINETITESKRDQKFEKGKFKHTKSFKCDDFYKDGIKVANDLIENFARKYKESAEKINQTAWLFKKNNGIDRVEKLQKVLSELTPSEKFKDENKGVSEHELTLQLKARAITHFLQYGTLGRETDPNGGRSSEDPNFSARAFLLKELRLGKSLDQVIHAPKDKLYERVLRQLKFLALLQPLKELINNFDDQAKSLNDVWRKELLDKVEAISVSQPQIFLELRQHEQKNLSNENWLLSQAFSYCLNQKDFKSLNTSFPVKSENWSEASTQDEAYWYLQKFRLISIYSSARENSTPEQLQSRVIKDFEQKLATACALKKPGKAFNAIKKVLEDFAIQSTTQQNRGCFPAFFQRSVDISNFRQHICNGLNQVVEPEKPTYEIDF